MRKFVASAALLWKSCWHTRLFPAARSFPAANLSERVDDERMFDDAPKEHRCSALGDPQHIEAGDAGWAGASVLCGRAPNHAGVSSVLLLCEARCLLQHRPSAVRAAGWLERRLAAMRPVLRVWFCLLLMNNGEGKGNAPR